MKALTGKGNGALEGTKEQGKCGCLSESKGKGDMRRLEKQAEATKGFAGHLEGFGVYPKSNKNPVSTFEQRK